MAIFQSFFDESGKFKDHKVVAFCGVVSPLSAIQQLETEWRGLLRHYGIPWLSMKTASRISQSFSPQYKAKSIAERIEVLKPFADCIRKNIELGVAITIDVDGYEKLSVEAKKRLGGSGNPHYCAFLAAVVGAVSYIQQSDRISLICDDDEETALNCFQFYRRVRKIDPKARERMIAITFAEDKEFVPLQAADFLSYLGRREAYRQFFNERYDFLPLFRYLTRQGETNITWAVSFYDKAKLKELEPRLEKSRLGTKSY